MTVGNLRFTSEIHGPAETIFDVVADMPNYVAGTGIRP
jgi:hypothetical protein